MGMFRYFHTCNTLFATFFHQITSLWHDCLQSIALFFVKKNQFPCWLTSSQHDMSCCLAWSGWQNLMTCRPNILDIFLLCWHVGSQHVIWVVSQHDTIPWFSTKINWYFQKMHYHTPNWPQHIFTWQNNNVRTWLLWQQLQNRKLTRASGSS